MGGVKDRRSRKKRDTDSSSEDEDNWRFITTQPEELFDQVRSQLGAEVEEFQPLAVDREQGQGGDKDECPNEGDEDRK